MIAKSMKTPSMWMEEFTRLSSGPARSNPWFIEIDRLNVNPLRRQRKDVQYTTFNGDLNGRVTFSTETMRIGCNGSLRRMNPHYRSPLEAFSSRTLDLVYHKATCPMVLTNPCHS